MKGPWEGRVGLILHNTDRFAWAFKPADSPLYGGQARIDWLASDKLGRFWMVEVKQVSIDRKSINIMSEVSPGQREALSSIANTDVGIALLAVGQGDTLYLFDWRTVQWRLQQGGGIVEPGSPKNLHHRLPLSSAPIQVRWTGKKQWQERLDLYSHVVRLRNQPPDQTMKPTLIVPMRSPKSTAPSLSTLKHGDSIPMHEKMLR